MLPLERAKTFRESVDHKFVHPKYFEHFSLQLKERGLKLVTLNGSFDLLHPGHLEMIYQASTLGDCLLLLLNTDASIQAYKSPKRPIYPLETRLQMLAAMEMVDHVSWFDETDPRAILEILKPAIHVNGSEYGENCIEAEVVKKHGGKIHIVTLLQGYSSTKTIEKIKSL